MTFDQIKLLRNSNKIILVELDLPLTNDFLISEQGGIWYKELTPDEAIVDGSVINPDRNVITFDDIPSVKVIYNEAIENYTKVDNYADLLAQEKSYYYVASTSIIYFHFDNFDPPLDRIIKLGTITGFCDKAGAINKGRYNDIYYEGRVINVPNISFKKDPISFGVFQYQNASFSFNNQDGFFDGTEFGIQQVSRQEARLYFGGDGLERDDFQLAYRSVIKDFNRSFSKYTVKGIDFRNQLNKSVPVNTYELTDYPNLDPDDEGEFIPVAYGVIKNAPCIQIDTSTRTFKMCDTTYNGVVSASVTAYKDGVAVSSGITYDYPNGTFTLAALSGEEITADFKVAIENPMDVIKDLIVNWASVAFISTNFNLTEWATETTNNASFKIGKYIDDNKKITEAISDVCKSFNGWFYTQKTGLYTVRTYDADRAISKIIQNYDWRNDPVESNPQKDFLSSVVVKYDKDINEDETSQYVNNDYKLEAIAEYSIENTREIETDLSDEASAILLSDEVMEIAKDIVPIVKRKTYMEHFDIELMDFIYACHDRDQGSTDFKVYEVIGIDYNFNTFEITFTMRFVEDTLYANNWAIWDKVGWDISIWSPD